MKLVIAGNLANYGYFLTKMIRGRGIDAHLLMEKYPRDNTDPKNFENNLSDYPEWIKFWNNHSTNWKFEIIKKMRKYDLIQSSTELPIFALFSRKPNISFTTGSDIIELAHKNSIKGFLLRTAYKKSKLVIFPGLYMYDSIKKLKIKKAIFIPPIWDYSKFYSKDNNNSKFTIFHPTSHNWTSKRNDIFIKAFVEFVKNYPNVHLIMINRGKDFQKSKMILAEENILDKVTIIPKAVPQNNLVEYYNNSDVVVDQFLVGSTGLIGQEAMACERPLIQLMNEGLYQKFYSKVPPILNASTVKQIYEKLALLKEDPSLAKNIGIKSREWLLKYHNAEKIIKKYIYLYNAIEDNMSFENLKNHLQKMD